MACLIEKEDLFHLFLSCECLDSFHDFIYDLLEKLFVHSVTDLFERYTYMRIFILGLSGQEKGVNIHFVNFMLSIARLCIMKKRQMIKNGTKNVDLIQYFRYTLKHYINYFYTVIPKNLN